MSLRDHPRAYGTAAVAAAFTLGIVVTLALKDLYPDLETRFQQSRRRRRQRGSVVADGSSSRRSSWFFTPVQLEDRESDESEAGEATASTDWEVVRGEGGKEGGGGGYGLISVDGIEGCIGNTPLVVIRSLSEATGRTILAKAELLNPSTLR